MNFDNIKYFFIILFVVIGVFAIVFVAFSSSINKFCLSDKDCKPDFCVFECKSSSAGNCPNILSLRMDCKCKFFSCGG